MIKKYLYLFLLGLIATSCSLVDVLDKVPAYDADLEGAIKDQKTVELALNGIYSYLPGNGFNVIFATTNGSFMGGTLNRQSSITSGNSVYMSERYCPTLTYNSSFSDPEWNADYEIIKNANFLLEACQKVPAKEFSGNRKNEILGEIYFLRGFAYGRLMLRYAEYWDLESHLGLILRSELPNVENAKKQRSTVAESYDAIFSDLDKAIELAPKQSKSSQGSCQAAKVLKARLLLYSKQYAKAAEVASEVIPEIKLESTYADVFDKHSSTPEILFARVFLSDASSTDTRVKAFGTKNPAGKGGYWCPTEEFLSLLGNDPRESAIVAHIDSVTFSTPQYNCKTVKKYLTDKNDMPVIFLRAAEAYLIKAEALYRSGAGIAEAYAPIEVLRTRAGAEVTPPTTIEELEDAIFNEWIIEMSFENWHEFYATSRFDKPEALKFDRLLSLNKALRDKVDLEMQAGADKGQAYLQRICHRRIDRIPAKEMDSNTVEQNPGY
ncbi:MAG: RagB/SusD family nutrient uptake outer membrane protein [Bacteroidales bacterium]